MRTTGRRLLATVAALALFTAACGDDDTSSPGTAPGAGGDVAGEVTVFAAASLTDAFTEIGDAFTAANPDVEVAFNFAGSSALAAQILEGAPADVFASADLANMATLTDADATRTAPVVFTTNLAQIIVEAGNPQGITGVADLADPELLVISCAPEVPCGRYAQQILDNAGVTVEFRSFEENVRAVVSKVTLGEADAGIVYVTDVINAGDAAEGVEVPAEVNVVAEYPAAVTAEAPNPAAAQAFVDFLLSDEGRSILESYGFVSP
jgi:molybdate transport system substrate-binding protein